MDDGGPDDNDDDSGDSNYYNGYHPGFHEGGRSSSAPARAGSGTGTAACPDVRGAAQVCLQISSGPKDSGVRGQRRRPGDST